jgi:lipoyl(octanoyl) transferase
VVSDRKKSTFAVGAATRADKVVADHDSCLIIDLGFIGYAEAFALQQHLVAARKAGAIEDVLLVCEHPHVITMGRNGKREHLLASDRVLQQKNVEFHPTDRGGDVTYHGPGQIVGYPILNLGGIRRDVGWYVRMLEETMIRASADFGITAGREPGKTGIWVGPTGCANSASSEATSSSIGAPEKLGAIGVHLSRWVTSHGFAYNVSTDLRYFDLIVPCGIADRKVTSLEKILSRRVDRTEAMSRLVTYFVEIFGLAARTITRGELFERLKHGEQPVALTA